VHGIGQQHLGRNQILDDWLPALTDGLERLAGRRPRPDLDVAYYGNFFHADPEDDLKGTNDVAPEDRLAGIDDAELAELTETIEEIVTPEDLAAAGTAVDKALLWLPLPVQRLVGAVDRHFPGTSGVLYLGDLRQVRSYLRDPALKAKVDRKVAEAAENASVVIGHSLGSVVAYEYLRQDPDRQVKLLLTLGSPLGLKMVRKRLPAGESGAVKWVNVRDPHDPVAAAGPIDQWYPTADDHPANNGFHAHDAERYLCSKAVGNAVIRALPELGR
jgi:hypothetical protein